MDGVGKNIKRIPKKGPVRSGLLGLGLALLLFALSQAHGVFGASEVASAPPVCSGWHRGQGDAHPVDLGRMARSYEELKTRLSRSVAGSMKKEVETVSLKRHDAELPACRRSDRRTFRPEGKIPPEFFGKKLWFTEVKAGKHLVAPELVRNDPAAIVFATRTEKFDDLAEASRSLDRPVSLAPRELAQALGVRCGPAVVVISQSGEVEIHENP